jgi:hypothetical protein
MLCSHIFYKIVSVVIRLVLDSSVMEFPEYLWVSCYWLPFLLDYGMHRVAS